ncbi:MAG: hypothetical protein ACREV9_06875 [Burkholderiales bacterium]
METPYKGVRPYCEADAAYFFGREAEIELVCEVFRAARLSVIFGPRGIGKTSLLQAGVAPHLRHTAAQRENVIVFDCTGEDPIARFGAALRNASRERVPNFLSLDTIIKTISQGEKLLIILDQFEECVTKHKAFTAELIRLMGEPDLSMHFLLAARDEAEFALQPLLARLPNVFDGMLRLRPLSDQAARAAIVGPIEVFNSRNPGLETHIEPEAIEAILTAAKDDVANQIDTVRLQRILAALWDYEFSSGVDTLRQASVNSLVARDEGPPPKEAEIFDDAWPSTLLLTPEAPLPAAIPPQPERAAEARARKEVFAYAALAAFALAAAIVAFFALKDDPEPQIAFREPATPAPMTAAEPRVPPPSISAPQAGARSTVQGENSLAASTREPEKPFAPPIQDSKQPIAPPIQESEKPIAPPMPESKKSASIPDSGKPIASFNQRAEKPVASPISEPEKSNSPVAQPPAIASAPAPAPAVPARESRMAPGDSSPPAAVISSRERPSPSVVKSPADEAVAAQVNIPRLFIHVREKSSATSELIKALENNGIAVSGIKEVDRGPRIVDLRYFHPREKKEANEIARKLKKFDIKIAQVKYISGYEEAAPDRQYELWFPPKAPQ